MAEAAADFAEAVARAERAAASSDARQIVVPLEKSAFIVDNYNLSTRAVAAALGISRSAVVRAVASAQAGRSPGRNGRPTALSEDEEKALVEWALAAWSNKDGMSNSQLLCKVQSSISETMPPEMWSPVDRRHL